MRKIKALISIALSALTVLSFSSCASQKQSVEASNDTLSSASSGVLAVHFLDVGQGDSEFIELPNGETMLIDAGEAEEGKTVSSDLKKIGVRNITYLVATHPHSDHIGGLAEVLSQFVVENVYMPNAVSSSQTYSDFLDAVEAESCNVVEARSGVDVVDTSDLSVSFLAPVSAEYDDLNNYSAVVKITYGENSFIFMGDAEELSENEITADVSANVIKVGHHGSSTSSSQSFVNRVLADYAVIECGKDNSYGHPHQEIVERWEKSGAKVLRTDLLGNILITSNGKEISYVTEGALSSLDDSSATDEGIGNEQGTQADNGKFEYEWVLNTSSKKIHYPSCRYAESISDKNRDYSNESISTLKAEGYSPCGECKPAD